MNGLDIAKVSQKPLRPIRPSAVLLGVIRCEVQTGRQCVPVHCGPRCVAPMLRGTDVGAAPYPRPLCPNRGEGGNGGRCADCSTPFAAAKTWLPSPPWGRRAGDEGAFERHSVRRPCSVRRSCWRAHKKGARPNLQLRPAPLDAPTVVGRQTP